MLQKFHRGDRVRIGKMPSFMAHFKGEVDALVVGSYVDLCYAYVNPSDAKRSYKQYELFVLSKHPGTAAWYDEDQLTAIAGPSGVDLLNSCLRVPFG